MSYKIRFKRLTVSQIVNLFLYKDRDILYGSFSSGYEMSEGKRIHSRLGYDQPWLFRRYFWDGKEWWLILGCPDKMDEKTGTIRELKTFGEKNISKNILTGATIQCQLYCWLTGLENWVVSGHSVYTNKTSKRLGGKYDRAFVERVLMSAIELKQSLTVFGREYRVKKERILKETMSGNSPNPDSV